MAMTWDEVKKEAKALGMEIKWDYNGYEEYRVNFKGGKEATAYYTVDLEDAINTARAMVKERG